MHYSIEHSDTLKGSIAIPPSKSHTLRAVLFASLAHGQSIIHHYLVSPDTIAMINACQLLGAEIIVKPHQLIITGTQGKPHTPTNIIDAGNSGQVLRFIGAIAALCTGFTVITGDPSVRYNRPIQPLLDGLTQLNVFAVSTQGNRSAPIIIKGPLKGGITILDGEDSQPVSGLLIASAFAKKETVIHVKNAGEKPWIDLTLDWFNRLGINYQKQDYSCYTLPGHASYAGFQYTVPGDFSSSAFPLAAALITQSEVTLTNLDMNDIQGDKILFDVLKQMGALFEIDSGNRAVRIKPSPTLIGKTINVNNHIDSVPILAVLGCFAKGETVITGAAIARKKESDRLSAITQELKKMGADITEFDDGLIIKQSILKNACVSSINDHRIAMALTIAALSVKGNTTIENIECIDKSYPGFAQALKTLGATIDVC